MRVYYYGVYLEWRNPLLIILFGERW
jgi:hypothetical protein